MHFFKKITILIAYFGLVCHLQAHSQAPTITSDVANTSLVCIGKAIEYRVVYPTGYTQCGSVVWNIKSGSGSFANGLGFTSTTNPTKITWVDQKPNKVEVEVVVNYRSSTGSCTTPETTTLTFTHILRTVLQESFFVINAPSTLDFCDTGNVGLSVSQMFIPNTGTGSVVLQTEVDNYEWVLPAGWRQVGSNNAGTVNTNVNSILIQPIPGSCSTRDTVVVRGVANNISCPSLPVSKSFASNILLNSTAPTVTVSPPQGFMGTTSCNTTPVTFSTQISNQGNCGISSYSWTIPANSWTIQGPSNGNTITLQPTGTDADQKEIKVKVALGCGSNIEGTFTPTFIAPAIVGVSPLCSSSTFSVSNAQGVALTWSSSDTWIATVNSAGLVSRVGNVTGQVVITASFPCAVNPVPKPIWVGQPYLSSLTYDGQLTPNSCNMGMYQTFTGGDHVLTATAQGAAGNPSLILNTFGSPYVHGDANGNNFNFNTNSKHLNSFEFTISSNFNNACGSASSCTYFTNMTTLTSPFPNPSESEFMLQLGSEGNLKNIAVYNSTQEQVFASATTEKELKIGTRQLPDGMYVVKIIIKDKILTYRLQIKH